MEAPNRKVTETWPSRQGHSSWILVSSPVSRTPPATRLARPELPGYESRKDWLATLWLCWAATSMCWPSPDRWSRS